MAFATIDVTKGITGVLPTANATYTSLRPNAQPLIINGDMSIAQRSTSVSSLTSSGAVQTVDRIKNEIGSIGTYTVAQESLSSGNAYNNGFRKAWRIDTTTADASPAAGDSLYVTYHFEGQDLQLFKKGTSNAEKVTLRFWVKSSKTGTHIVELLDNDNSRFVSLAYTISSADTWENHTLTFPADTTGAFADDNGVGLGIHWYMAAGDTYTSGTLGTTWNTTQANRAVGQVNLAGSVDNNWYLTGVQLEVGSTATPFEHRSPAEEQQLCFRYTRKFTSHTFGRARDGDSFYAGNVVFQPPMRGTPTLKSGADFSVSTGSGGSPTINTGQGASGESLIISNGSANWTTNAFARLTDAVFEAEL